MNRFAGAPGNRASESSRIARHFNFNVNRATCISNAAGEVDPAGSKSKRCELGAPRPSPNHEARLSDPLTSRSDSYQRRPASTGRFGFVATSSRTTYSQTSMRGTAIVSMTALLATAAIERPPRVAVTNLA